MKDTHDGLQEIINEALGSMAEEANGDFDPQECNLAEFCRRTGLSRQRARTIKANGFKAKPHGNAGAKHGTTVLTGHAGLLDDLLRRGVTNSQVIFERLSEQGYEGGLTTVKVYISEHRDLVPVRRKATAPQGRRAQRFATAPGEAYQMDWGFVNVVDWEGSEYRIACFAMVCHHCGTSHVEFFPNARQESLFIGMAHAFMYMGVPESVLTDNMKSVVKGRDPEGHPIWNAEYAAFMGCVGFKTKLCKPRHPFTKGKVERLVRYVKENFLAGRSFTELTRLNEEALRWCEAQAGRFRRAVACVPAAEHREACCARTHAIADEAGVEFYLCPARKIAFDGFVSYEGRKFGVPYWYDKHECRVCRDGRHLHIYSDDLSRELTVHEVTWSRKDSWCEGQWADAQPFEEPSQPVATTILQVEPRPGNLAFAKFDFERLVM